MTEPEQQPIGPQGIDNLAARAERRRFGLKLFRRLVIYHVTLAALLVGTAILFPALIDELPIGGISTLEASGDLMATPPP